MKQYFIEVSCPCHPSKGDKFRVMRKFHRDGLSPTLITLFSVMAEDREDAIAKTMQGEAKAIIGGKK